MDPGLRLINQLHDPETGLHYQLARYYDPQAGRFISPDPAGVSDSLDAATPAELRLDLNAYAAGQPWRFFDPDGAAKISYYAITNNAGQQTLGQIQGFTKARWAFVIEDIQPGGDLQSAAGRRRQTYAQQGSRLLSDGGGSFIPGYTQTGVHKSEGGKALVWSGQNSVQQAFAEHYGEARISMANFIIEDMDDDAAAQLIWYFSQSVKERGSCKNEAPGWLPDIRFAPGEDSIRVTQDKGVDTLHPANKQRILNCQPATTLPVNYANDEERRRLLKYQAAAELQESAAPSAIYKDCGPDACRSRTDITVNGHSYYASYGRTQFVTETFLRTLRGLIPTLSPQELGRLGLNQAVVLPNGRNGTMADMAEVALRRAESAASAFENHRKTFGKALTPEQAEKAWESLSETGKAKFIRDTGLGKTEFIDMLCYQPEGRARTEAEGKNAFGSEAANRLLDGSGQSSFKSWLMGFYQSQDGFNFVSQRFLQDNLRAILNAPPIKDRFVNPETPGTEAHRQAQTQIENDLMSRVAGLHNSGSLKIATNANPPWPHYVSKYIQEFSSTAGRGDWRSLRCSDEIQKIHGL